MITSTNIEKWETCGNITIAEGITTDKGYFNLYREYIGGIDEDGNEDLYGACGCIISLNETKPDCTEINEVKTLLENSGYDVEIAEEVVYNTYPVIHKSVVIENYSSEDDTNDIIEIIKKYFS